MAKNTFSYERTMAEINAIIEKLTNNEINIDELAIQVKKARELLQQCQSKLRETEQDLDKLTK